MSEKGICIWAQRETSAMHCRVSQPIAMNFDCLLFSWLGVPRAVQCARPTLKMLWNASRRNWRTKLGAVKCVCEKRRTKYNVNKCLPGNGGREAERRERERENCSEGTVINELWLESFWTCNLHYVFVFNFSFRWLSSSALHKNLKDINYTRFEIWWIIAGIN